MLVPGFMPNYVFILKQDGQRLTSGQVTGAGNGAQPVSGSQNKCLQCLMVLGVLNTKSGSGQWTVGPKKRVFKVIYDFLNINMVKAVWFELFLF